MLAVPVEVTQAANDTCYGLVCAVFTLDIKRVAYSHEAGAALVRIRT